MAVTAQVEFTADELLADAPVAEPLIAGGVRCHGGFDDDGGYVSPRTLFRSPAIDAWQARHTEVFGTEPIDVPMETWGEHFPNVAQARFLVGAGVAEPLVSTLTRIGTVEGYGANIRLLHPAGWQRHFVEDIRGTAIDHLGRGLFEAHGRDEAGWEVEAGHKDMWFAARDIAFPAPTADLDIEAMLTRMGFGQGAPSGVLDAPRLLPLDIDAEVEFTVALMIRVLFIEVGAFHTFRWAEAWLSDPDLVAGEGQAAQLVAYIRADETPHVRYLATALTELRDRTWIGDTGKQHSGDGRHPLAAPARPKPGQRAGGRTQGHPRRGRALVPQASQRRRRGRRVPLPRRLIRRTQPTRSTMAWGWSPMMPSTPMAISSA